MKIECIINSADDDSLTAIRREVVRHRKGGHLVGARLTFGGGDATRIAREAMDSGRISWLPTGR